MKARYKFHSIGQGCFYSALIKKNESESFSMVYDCGSISSKENLKKEIDIFKSELTNNRLNLLIISHFDEDHINGITYLLKNITCDIVIIPYYTPIDRLIQLIRSSSNNQDYLDFLSNPIAFITEKELRIGKIVFTFNYKDFFKNFISENKNPNSDNFMSFEFISSRYREELLNYFSELGDDNIINKDIEFLIWEKRYKNEYLDLKLYLDSAYPSTQIEKFKHDLTNYINRNNITYQQLFYEDDYLSELKLEYKKYFKNINQTSLITYHTLKERYWSTYKAYSIINLKGILLTGDISLKNKSILNRLLVYYKDQIDNINIFQIPHHGSKHNWNKGLLNYFTKIKIFVINHGLGRIHPNVEVIQDVKSHNIKNKIVLVNEVNNLIL